MTKNREKKCLIDVHSWFWNNQRNLVHKKIKMPAPFSWYVPMDEQIHLGA